MPKPPPPIRKDRKPPKQRDERHTLRVRVGRYSWWDRVIERKHDPRWTILLSVNADFRMLVGCGVRDCSQTTIR